MQPTALSKAWKMNGLAFENVNYREIQLTPGAKKKKKRDTPISVIAKEDEHVFVQRHTERRKGDFNPEKNLTGGTIKH